MRASSTVIVLIPATFLLVGCSQTTSPTSPTSALPFTSSPRAVSAAAPHQVPFKGTMQGTDTDSDPTPTSIVVTTDGMGTATHLGRFSFTQRVTLSFTTFTSAGTSHWVAANGDSFDTTIAGSGQPTGTPGDFSITDLHTITGGTGRFAGAHGLFTVKRVASGITFVTSGSFEGTITSPGAADWDNYASRLIPPQGSPTRARWHAIFLDIAGETTENADQGRMADQKRNPGQKARDTIDAMLDLAGWKVQSRKKIDFNAGFGIAVREYQTDVAPADYVLCTDKKPVGVIEAKPQDWGEGCRRALTNRSRVGTLHAWP
jgi:hypothetical protein